MNGPSVPDPSPRPLPTDDRAAVDVAIDIGAPVSAVWRALTTGDGLAWWMGPGSTIDARPGGSVDVADPVGGMPRRGLVSEVDRERLLRFEWWPTERPGLTSTVTIELTEVDDGTRVSVVESVRVHGLPSATASVGSMAPRSSALAPTPTPASVADRPTLRAGWMWRLAMVSLATSMCGAVRC